MAEEVIKRVTRKRSMRGDRCAMREESQARVHLTLWRASLLANAEAAEDNIEYFFNVHLTDDIAQGL